MAIMKRELLVDVVAGRDVCGPCEYFYRPDDDEPGCCTLFNEPLDDESHRPARCVDAEGKMVEAQIRLSAAKAADNQIQKEAI